MTYLFLALSSCTTSPRESPKHTTRDDSIVVGFVDTSVFLDGHLGGIHFIQTSPRTELWDLHTDPRGYFWDRLSAGTYRLKRVLVRDSSGMKIAEMDSPSEGKSAIDFELAGHGSAQFLGSYRLTAAWKVTATGTAVASVVNTVGIDRFERPTEQAAWAWLLKKLNDRNPVVLDAIEQRLNLIGGQVPVEGH